MELAGTVSPDAPDPRVTAETRLARLPFPVMTLTPQPTVEEWGAIGHSSGADERGTSMTAASITYTLWRNPDDRSDPVNLVELDEPTRVALEEGSQKPRPAWLIELAERGRHPMLWEAVRTAWHRDASPLTTLPHQLVHHANYVLTNRFREELGLEPGPAPMDAPWHVRESHVNPAASLELDGTPTSAAEIDTDPFVYAVGIQLRPDLVATAVIARDDLPYVRLTLATRPPRRA